MVVFVTGVHGTGKTYLCERYIENNLKVFHESASALIKKAKNGANWSVEKRVENADENQIALTQEVKKITSAGHKLILDGHTVLLDKLGGFIRISPAVFSELEVEAIILIEATVETISCRLNERDSTKDIADIKRFISVEREQAQFIARELGIPLRIMIEPTVEAFSEVVDKNLQEEV